MGSIKPWHWFQRIVERGGISAAARDLDVTVAALSQMLKREEQQLGVRLFQRTTRKLTITHEGELWYRATMAAQAALDGGLEQMNQRSGELTGTLRIAAPSDFGRTRLMHWLADFSRLHPGVVPILQIHDGHDDLIADSIDMAIRYGEPQEPGLIARALFPENRRVVAASPAYWAQHGKPTHPNDLTGHACLAFSVGDRPYVRWPFSKGRTTANVKVIPSRISNDSAIVGEWSRQGLGVMYRSAIDVNDDIEAGHLELALNDWMGEPCPLFMNRPGNRQWPWRVQAFWSFCELQARNRGVCVEPSAEDGSREAAS
jgi:DNA-binding transcriptional LysR family regulator